MTPHLSRPVRSAGRPAAYYLSAAGLLLLLAAAAGADETSFVQTHLDNRVSTPLPKGVLVIKDTLRLTQSYGYRLSGSGGVVRNAVQASHPKSQATSLKWEGPPGKPMLEIHGGTGLVVQGLNFIAGAAGQGILIRDSGGSLNIAIRDCGFVGGSVGLQCATAQGEQTCANITYDNCHWQEQSEACVRVMNTQSLQHLFLRPLFTLSPIAIDVQHGGDVSVLGGGSYEVGVLLKLGNVGRNCRGFDVTSFRFDGKTTRTAWVTYADPTRTKTFGPITFRNCSQNNGQQTSALPLLTAAPGSRVVARECSFDGGYVNWARVYSDRTAGGELVVENCDGLNGDSLASYVTATGDRAYYEFRHCGTLYGPVGSVSTFPDAPSGPFGEAELESLRALLSRKDCILNAADGMKRIKNGKLVVTLPEEE